MPSEDGSPKSRRDRLPGKSELRRLTTVAVSVARGSEQWRPSARTSGLLD